MGFKLLWSWGTCSHKMKSSSKCLPFISFYMKANNGFASMLCDWKIERFMHIVQTEDGAKEIANDRGRSRQAAGREEL